MPNAPKKTDAKTDKAAKAPKSDKLADAQSLAKRIESERETAASIFAQAKTAAVSIPVKSLAAFGKSYKRECSAHSIGRNPSPRQAAALAVAAAASSVTIADGAKIPRKFTMRGAEYAIENGALSDAIASGLASYHSASETITLLNANELRTQCGSKAIKI